jgi:hypothetical protein
MGMRHRTWGAGLRFPEHPPGDRIDEYAILSGRNVMKRATALSNHQCISSEDVQGTEVYGPDGKNIGEIDHLIIDKISGRVGSPS